MAAEEADRRYPEEVEQRLEIEREYEDEIVRMEPLPVMFERSADRFTGKDAQLYKGGVYDRSLVAEDAIDAAPEGEYAALTYGEVRHVVRMLATGFRALGVETGDRVGMFAENRMEWAQTDQALLAAGAITTTVYRSSSPEQVQYLLDDPGATGVVVSDEDLLERTLAVADGLNLRFIVVMDEVGPEYDDREGIYTLGEVLVEGAKRWDADAYGEWLSAIDPDDLATLVYTSGTTGRPKGVRLTHRNLRSNVNQAYVRAAPRDDRPDDAFVLDQDIRTVSYLPLAHIFERTVGNYMMQCIGATVAYAESVDTLKEDFGLVQPNFATSVPRVYEKIYDAIREEAREKTVLGMDVGERIFEWAVEVGRQYEREAQPGIGLRTRAWLADKLVFSDVKQALGGNVELMVSGGGTLSKELSTLYHGMGLPVLDGYGLTEAAPVVTENVPEDYRTGSIGLPLVDMDIRVDESVAPEGKFDDALGTFGELQIKGPNVTDGYWNMPEKTDESFTDDGYFKTGDIVQQRPDGYLVFRERSKQILVLSTGKNVAPSPIEDGFSESEVVEQVMVVGDGEKFISALVVPNFEHLRRAAREEGVDVPEDSEAICEDEHVREAVAEEVDRVNETFESHETIKEFRMVPEEWTEENEMLTPSKKKKRRQILDRYDHLVMDIYGEADAEAEADAGAEPAE